MVQRQDFQADDHPEHPRPPFFGGEMGERIRAFDWQSSALGSVDTWPQSLRSLVKTLLASRYPMVLTWGEQFIQFYNDAYSQLIGDKHPAALGCDIRITLAEAWDTLGPMIHQVMATGIANWTPALLLVLERSGYREESYFSVSHAPAEDDHGRTVGMLAVCSEVTQQILGERRLRLLRDLADRAGEVRSVEAACADMALAIASHPLDVPFALLYLRGTEGALSLEAAVGLDLAAAGVRGEGDGAWGLCRAAAGETVEIGGLAGRVTVVGGPWGEAVDTALVMPLASADQAAPLGVLVVGVSPNRALDEGYRSFFELLAGQVAVSLRNAHAYEHERRRAEALAELDRAKTTFFSNVSHEFRTPLALILGPVEAGLNDTDAPLQPAQRERQRIVHRNALRLLKLVNSLLDFSRIEAGRAQAVFEPIDLVAVTTELASVFRSAIEQAGLRLTVDCPPLDEPVWVDRDMWEKIVLNLLSNAFKFTLDGEIGVSLRRIPAGVELRVSDTGCGIAPEELPKLFERFYRVEGAQARTHEGTGIGLALVAELVRLHGGTIAVESIPGEGSTFVVHLRTGTAHLPDEHLAGAPGAAVAPTLTTTRAEIYVEEALRWMPDSEPPQGPAATAPVGAARILLADDNADLRAYLGGLLGRHYRVETVADGQTAFSRARTHPPDLVLSDVMMPGLDGIALVRALRADPVTRAIPVVLLSARSGQEATIEGLEAGADDYLTKPFAARELLARVRTHLELAQMRKDVIAAQERLRAEQQARTLAEEARRVAEQANRLKDEFLATVSHELRTPLNPILGWTQLLRRGNVELAKQATALEVIERNAKLQNQLIADLLDVSRIEQGKFHYTLEDVELVGIVGTAAEAVQTLADGAHIALAVCLPTEPIRLQADPTRLQQVVWNLLTNAVKFTPNDGSVMVLLERRGDLAVLTVKDTGVGIAPEFLPYLWERFRQADSTTTRARGGLGLGLFIVRHIVEFHQGHVRAESAGEGQGATFVVELPIRSGAGR